jgi:DNA-binding transcriptional LysR family regulator
MTLQQLRYVIEISETGSFSAAAKRLYISQPSLSFTIKDIEDKLGIAIFLRKSRGVSLTKAGEEFVRYAKQVVLQADLLEAKYAEDGIPKQRFSVSSQHYTFASMAFVRLINACRDMDYELKLRETKTQEVIEDVRNLSSELGLIVLNNDNEQVISRILKENDLIYTELFTVVPHVLVGQQHPLAAEKTLSLAALEDYPCISFSQGDHHPMFFSEEVMSTLKQRRSVVISDRGALADILISTDSYIFATGVYITDYVNHIVSVPLDVEEQVRLCLIRHRETMISPLCETYMGMLSEIIEKHISQ